MEHNSDGSSNNNAGSAAAMASYRPSSIVLVPLFYWTLMLIVLDIMLLRKSWNTTLFTSYTDPLIISLVLLSNLYFISQAVMQRFAPISETRQALRRGRFLTLCILSAAVHARLWWRSSDDVRFKKMFFRQAMLAGECALMMMFIAIRYSVDVYMIGVEGELASDRKLKEHVSTPDPSVDETSTLLQIELTCKNGVDPQPDTVNLHSNLGIPLYRPSILLNLTLIILSTTKVVLEIIDDIGDPCVSIVQGSTYSFSIVVNGYLLVRSLQSSHTQTLKHATEVSRFAFDLIPLSFGMRALFFYIYWTGSIPLLHSVPGSVELVLIIYVAIRYMRSVYSERRRRIRSGIEICGAEPHFLQYV
ncbi:hypothetical protein BDN70DRAFT_872054 [Pholiota conissans]|uniref:Transmembrane protein n=1 Tax=Pholiota conissans TaxID=109636 RepID=A0A9P6CZ50_9AGAR|nr:hypothetical protein BDN70DRAFT_872054 [Pholiota conissans]